MSKWRKSTTLTQPLARDFRPTGSTTGDCTCAEVHDGVEFFKTKSDASYQQLHDEATAIMKEFHNSPEYKQYKEEKNALVEAHHNQCTCGKKEYHYEGPLPRLRQGNLGDQGEPCHR